MIFFGLKCKKSQKKNKMVVDAQYSPFCFLNPKQHGQRNFWKFSKETTKFQRKKL
jgi:hypothetical protein